MPAMKRLMWVGIVTLVALVSACGEPPAPISGDISGTWHGARWEGRARVLWRSMQEVNGPITITFLTCFNGEALSQEVHRGTGSLLEGYWNIELDELEYTDLRTGKTSVGVAFDHSYEFTEISDARMRYRSDEFGERYEVTRVADDFELTCPPGRPPIQTDPGDARGRDAWIVRGPSPDDDDEAEGSDEVTAD